MGITTQNGAQEAMFRNIDSTREEIGALKTKVNQLEIKLDQILSLLNNLQKNISNISAPNHYPNFNYKT